MRFGRLGKIILKSEGVHYKRLFELLKKIETWSGKLIAWPIIAFLVTIFHYMFSFMHTLFEISLIFIRPKQFDSNMRELELKFKN